MDHSTDLSILSLFLQADIFVKGVMLVLLGMSVWAWSMWFSKGRQLGKAHKQASAFEDAFWNNRGVAQSYQDTKPEHADHALARLFIIGTQEAKREATVDTGEVQLHVSGIERARRLMDAAMTRDMENLEKGLPFLATVASSAPFIGLLGTVWGIMNSFQNIGATNNTSLAVVAPGIAEALLATAIGLFAAIPAVIAYNRLSSSLGRYSARLEAFCDEFLAAMQIQHEGADVKSLKKTSAKKEAA